MGAPPFNDGLFNKANGIIASPAWRAWYSDVTRTLLTLSGGTGIPITPSGSVVAETTFALVPNAGAAATFSRGDHTHGSPTLDATLQALAALVTSPNQLILCTGADAFAVGQLTNAYVDPAAAIDESKLNLNFPTHTATTVAGAPLTIAGQDITFNHDATLAITGNNLYVVNDGHTHATQYLKLDGSNANVTIDIGAEDLTTTGDITGNTITCVDLTVSGDADIGMTDGSVLFSDALGVITENNDGLYYDDAGKILRVNETLKVRYGSLTVLYSEDFSGFSPGDDMTLFGWTWYQYLAEVGTFKATAAPSGECKATVANWAGAFVLDAGLAWTNYSVDFDVSVTGSRLNFGFRHNGATTYWMQCLPGVAGQAKIYKAGSPAFPGGATLLDAQTSPNPVTHVKIVALGTSIKIYYNNSPVATNDIVDATYATGSIAMSGYQAGWIIDNIVVNIAGVYENLLSAESTGGLTITPDSGPLKLVGDVQLPSDSDVLLFGAGQDASLVYNGTNLVLNPKVVGTGVLLMDTDSRIAFRDTAIYAYSSLDGWLNLVADIGVEVNAPILNVAELYCAGAGDFDGSVKTSANRICKTTRETVATTLDATDEIAMIDTDGGAITITLPAGINGLHYKIVNCGTSGNDVTIDGNGAENVMGSATQLLSDGEVLDLHFETTEHWW